MYFKCISKHLAKATHTKHLPFSKLYFNFSIMLNYIKYYDIYKKKVFLVDLAEGQGQLI